MNVPVRAPHPVEVRRSGEPGSVRRQAPAPTRTSTAERMADVLRRRITEGQLLPGARLSEEQLIATHGLGVSRNTLREAFRLLAHEGLLVHVLHRGVFVREPGEDDLIDLYRLRRAIECDVVRSLAGLDDAALRPLRDAVAAAEAAARRGDWETTGTANMLFHHHLVALAGSPRLDEVMRRLLAELRLAFHVVSNPQALYEPYVSRNRALLELLADGKFRRATEELEAYLRASQAQLLDALRDGGS